MESRNIDLSSSVWYKVTNDEKENYLLQATGSTFFVLVKTSPTIPTDEDGVHILSYMDCLNHMILPGIIWVKAKNGPSSISLSKIWST